MKTKLFLMMFFTLGVGNIFAQPSNNDCSSQGGVPVQLTVNGACSTLNVTGATQTMNSGSCYGSTSYQNDVWYYFTANASSQTVTVTPNSTYDAVVQLLTNCGIYSMVSGGCADAHNAGIAETLNATGLTVGTTYYIRVYSYNGTAGGNITVCVTGSGGGCSLTGVTPTLLSPGTTSSPGTSLSNTTPTLSWNSVSGAGMYGVYIRDMVSNTLVLSNDCATSGTSFSVPPGTLNNNGQYRWAVIAYSVCNSTCQSNQATQFYFQTTVTPPCTPPSDPTSPFGNSNCSGGGVSTNATPTLTWNSASSATGYMAYITQYPFGSGNPAYTSGCLSGTSHQISGGNLMPGMLYRWQPTAFSGNNCASSNCESPGSSSNIKYFYVPPIIMTGGPTTFCSGESVAFTTPVQSVNSVSYQWYKDGSPVGTGTGPIYATQSGNYYVSLTYSGSSYCGSTTIQSNPISVTVIDLPPPTITISANGTMLTSSSTTNNQWYLNGNSIMGAISQNYIFTQNGNYTVTVSDGNGCSATSTPYIVTTVSIQELTENKFITIYPNPNKGLFTLSYKVTGTEDLQIQVLNVVGEVVYSKEYKNVSGKFSKEISLTNTTSGMYSVQIKAGEKMYQQKLVKE